MDHDPDKPGPLETAASVLGGAIGQAQDAGRSALSLAALGAKTGAKLAVGTLFAGANVLLDLGARVTRALPLENGEVSLETENGTIAAVARSSSAQQHGALGWWIPDDLKPQPGEAAWAEALARVTRPIFVVDTHTGLAVASGGRAVIGADTAGPGACHPLRAFAPALHPSQLGDPAFRAAHNLRYAYLTGAMANGIGSEEIVESISAAGMLGFFGAAGLSPSRVEAAIDRLQRNLGDGPHGFNLIHSPAEPDLEAAIVDLYLRRSVRLVETSAFLDLTLPLLRYRLTGIHRDESGRIICPNQVIAKVSRTEVARKFLSPAPAALLQSLVEARHLTAAQAALAQRVPIAQDLTAEADSGGHTDNRPLVALLPTMIALRDELQREFAYDAPPRIGAAGGIGTPAAAAAAFAMGAAYIVTGSINQACLESGTSPIVREMLCQAGQADVTMAPAADMFEMGVKVQVLKWGTMFAQRARRLYDAYRAYASLDEIPAKERTALERDFFRSTFDEAWADTRRYFDQRDPRQIRRADADPKHKMALVFRSYLGQSSNWANAGEPSRKVDYQIWCGPAMGAFNEWTRGSFLEQPAERRVAVIAMNLMLGAAITLRAAFLQSQGAPPPPAAAHFAPMQMQQITQLLST